MVLLYSETFSLLCTKTGKISPPWELEISMGLWFHGNWNQDYFRGNTWKVMRYIYIPLTTTILLCWFATSYINITHIEGVSQVSINMNLMAYLSHGIKLTFTCITYMYVHVKSLQLYPTLCNPIDCSPPGFSVHGILQARTLEWVAIPFSRGSRDELF